MFVALLQLPPLPVAAVSGRCLEENEWRGVFGIFGLISVRP
jgi:hypothetical protein